MTGTITIAAAMTIGGAAVALAAGRPPEMTVEQKAEMEAYMKAGTPGAELA